MSPDTETTIELGPLRDDFAGGIFTAADEGWDEARMAWNLAVDQHPAAVVIPEDAADVARAVRFARDHGVRVAVQGTGHNAAAYGDLAGAMLIKTERMRDIAIDPATKTARVGAGVTWGEVVGPAAEHGLTALSGSSHDVGVVGYSLSGGVGWLARKHGLASERITAIELVGADGDLREVTALTDPDLFWALRGGGGNFGVVTALEFGLLPVPEAYAGTLFFPLERAGEVLDAWRRWAATAPDEATSIGRLLQIPPIPDVPEFLRGRSFAAIEVVFLGSEKQGRELLAPLRELGPEMDTFAMASPADLLTLHMDPPGPVPGVGDHQMLADLDAEAVERLVSAIGAGTNSPILAFSIRHIGGALGRRAENSGALGALDGRFMTFAVGMVMDPSVIPGIRAAFEAAREALDVVDNGAAYTNFAESPVEPEACFGERTLGRLREIRANVDPDGLFLANHSIDA